MSQAEQTGRTRADRGRIPLAVKLLYTAFVAVMVPYYLRCYGPTNFLYYCDVAVLMTLVAVWREDPLWASMPAVGILVPQAVWMVDFLGNLFGLHVLGMTAYMFQSTIPLFTRGLSLFHFWLPLFLVWIVWRLGYDRRAFWAWTALAWVLMLVCYFLMPAPPTPADNLNLPVNINYVYRPERQWAANVDAATGLSRRADGGPADLCFPADASGAWQAVCEDGCKRATKSSAAETSLKRKRSRPEDFLRLRVQACVKGMTLPSKEP